MDLTGGLAQEIAKLSAELQPIVVGLVSQVGGLVTGVQNRLDALEKQVQADLATDLGETLAALTAERTELVNDLHGLLDRLKISIHIEVGPRPALLP